MPASEISKFYSSETWAQLQKEPFDGYVILHGSIKENDQVKIRGVRSSFPDETREQMARELASNFVVRAWRVAGHTPVFAEVCVVFYDKQHQAIVFGYQTEGVSATRGYKGQHYLAIKSY